MSRIRVKPVVATFPPDPSVTQRRLDDLQRLFGMHSYPFSLAPNPDYLYVTGVMARTLAKTTFTIDQRQGLSVVMGDYGTGKTLLARYLYDSYTAGDVREPALTAYIPDPPHPQRIDFMKRIIQEFGGFSGKRVVTDVMEDLRKMVLNMMSIGRNCVLLIDEAQLLHPRQFGLIRELFNFNAGGQVAIQVVLFGTENLRDILREIPDLNDRVIARSTLEPLTLGEVNEMINFRLNRAGCKVSLFTSDAIQIIYDLSRGYPRKALKLAGASLWHVVELKQDQITGPVVEAAQKLDEIE